MLSMAAPEAIGELIMQTIASKSGRSSGEQKDCKVDVRGWI